MENSPIETSERSKSRPSIPLITKEGLGEAKFLAPTRTIRQRGMINYPKASASRDKKIHMREYPSADSIRSDYKIQRFPAASSAHVLEHLRTPLLSTRDWKSVQNELPETWKWDVEYHILHSKICGVTGSWTCTPLESDGKCSYPLTIASAPVVLPVEYHWSPCAGVTPPPDPHPAGLIDCSSELSLEVVRDLFLTFPGSIGFYILINGLLQIIVPGDFDTTWASSHLPHKYGGLKVCYIEQTLEPTMLPSTTETSSVGPPSRSLGTFNRVSGLLPLSRLPAQSSAGIPSLKLNDFVEARKPHSGKSEKYYGRIGLKLARENRLFIVTSTHIITAAILARRYLLGMFGSRRYNDILKLEDDWNDYAEIWADDRKLGRIAETFDKDVGIYPDGFHHDVTLIEPTSPTVVEDIASPVPNIGWLNRDSWASLRQQTSTVKILADTESSRSAKIIKCSCPSDVLVVGEGIFLNQKAAAGGSKNLREHNMSTWKGLVSRALLYRVYPDFDPPNGHSGTALYADGVREDGTQGPGIVGFQSFVQRSGHVQNFDMEGPALEQRLQLGRVAFYGAFEVPAELKRYDIV